MLRMTIIALCTLAMLAATLAAPGAPLARAQSDSGLQLQTEFLVPGSREVKFPHVVAGRGLVHVTGNANRATAFAWSKAASAGAFSSPVDLGPAEDQPDYSTTSVAIGPDGSVWVAWINQPARTIYLRQRNPQGQWGARRTVDSSSTFPVAVEVTVSSNNQIFVAWRDPDRPVRYRFSSDSGVNWSSRRDVSDVTAYASPISLASGPNGRVGVTFTAGAGDRLQVFVGLWNGNSFTTTRITPSSADWADSSLTFAANGRAYVAWRGVATSGGNAGAFFAEQQADGSWPRSRLVGGKVDGTVSINVDEEGNIHMSWIAEPSGGKTVFYAFKPSSDSFRGPVASGDTGALFNSRGYGSVADGTYNHVVSEEFNGSNLRTRYSLFAAASGGFGGEPVVGGGASRIAPASDGTVALTFRNLRGNPNEVRWRWGAPPSDTANDSGNWQPLGSEMRVAVPDTIRNNTSCQPSVLYTQLRNTATGTTEAQARSVSVNVDGVVEARTYLLNPFEDPSPQVPQLAAVAGAPGGAPNYTRVPLTRLNIIADTDCSGITTASVGASPTDVETTYEINDANFSGVVALPNLANIRPGPVPFFVSVNDGAGNTRVFELEVILDETKPVLNGGSVTATPDPRGDLFQILEFSGVDVDDTQYPGGFWGVWIANAPEPVADPLNDASLQWTIIETPDGGSDFVIDDWSLATGLTRDQLVPGEDYTIYVRFLDGAGNPTDDYLVATVAVSNVDPPEFYLPLITGQ